mmetsp:Transcript_59900/g.107800  ORF Transcript_59900/g.107800 Transcript_59900/m.107800 type:complete len:303 (+) Transcript_59900:82-990(+)
MVRAPRFLGVAVLLTLGAQVFFSAYDAFVVPRIAPLESIRHDSVVSMSAAAAKGKAKAKAAPAKTAPAKAAKTSNSKAKPGAKVASGKAKIVVKVREPFIFRKGKDGELKLGSLGTPFKVQIRTPYRGTDLDGDKLDNLDQWYKETITGKGGRPKGFMKDLMLRSFYGSWSPTHGYFRRFKGFTGPNQQPCDTDHDTALQTLKTNLKENTHFMGQDDGAGWFWLVAGQNPGGLYLYVTKSPPFGERPLALIREDNVEEFFDKVDWNMLFMRLHKWQLWGGKATAFPYPTKRGVMMDATGSAR